MNTQLIMDYLTALNQNNDREWYHAHKDDYKKANAVFEELLQALMLEIGKFDSSILRLSWYGIPVSVTTNRLIILRFAPIFRRKGSCRFL